MGAIVVLAGCSTNAVQPLGPDDPRFAKAVDAAQSYAAGYYHLERSLCGTAAGFRFGVQKDGHNLIVSIKPPKPRIDAIRLSLRENDMKIVEAHPFVS